MSSVQYSASASSPPLAIALSAACTASTFSCDIACAVSRAGADRPLEPRIARVAPQEVEARRVGVQPPIGRRRAQVELGSAAVKGLAGRRHPTRVGVLLP